MRVSVSRQVLWWSAVAAVIVLALWGLGNVMTPFLIGAGIAYALDPLADRLERSGLSRAMSVSLITLIAVLAFILVLVLVLPMLVRQLSQLVEAAPGYFDTAQAWLSTRYPQLLPEGGTMRSAMTELATKFSEQGAAVLVAVLGSLGNAIGVVLLLVIVPVVAFYLLLDWDRFMARIDEMLPREHAGTIRAIGGQINDSLAGFLRGQALVTLILATFYSVGLFAVGLPFGLVIGIMAAVLSIIPYVGVFTGGVTAMTVAAFHFWDQPQWMAVVLAIFVLGQIIEGNYLQPKIIGGHVGLHPVWLMIALAVFGKLFGFVGLIVAVPLGAIIGVLARFAAERYRESGLFTGREVLPDPPPPVMIEMVPRGTFDRNRKKAQAAHDAAVAEQKLREARQEARHAAEDAAQKDGARVAVATYPVLPPGPEGAVERLRAKAEVRTWGGSSPDGTDPADDTAAQKIRRLAADDVGPDGADAERGDGNSADPDGGNGDTGGDDTPRPVDPPRRPGLA